MATKASGHPPYTRRENFQCPKCGFRTMKLQYCAGSKEIKTKDGKHEVNYSCMHEVEGEHMHLVCSDCGFHQFRNIVPR